ncbi:hypothetical protein MRX96_051742 [Rhipicephalus microplus]
MRGRDTIPVSEEDNDDEDDSETRTTSQGLQARSNALFRSFTPVDAFPTAARLACAGVLIPPYLLHPLEDWMFALRALRNRGNGSGFFGAIFPGSPRLRFAGRTNVTWATDAPDGLGDPSYTAARRPWLATSVPPPPPRFRRMPAANRASAHVNAASSTHTH